MESTEVRLNNHHMAHCFQLKGLSGQLSWILSNIQCVAYCKSQNRWIIIFHFSWKDRTVTKPLKQ